VWPRALAVAVERCATAARLAGLSSMPLRAVVATVVVIASVVAGTAGAAAHPRSCGPTHARTLAHSAHARVYVRYVPQDQSHEVFGCRYRTGRSFFLGPHDYGSEGRDAVSMVAFNGPFVALNEEEISGLLDITAKVRVVDLRDGSRVHHWSRSGDACAGDRFVTALVVSRRGAAAWIAGIEITAPGGGCSEMFEVWEVEGPSRPRMLDSGSGIDPHHLVRRSGHVYWRNGGEDRAAAFR
jgi:hypothetical protein